MISAVLKSFLKLLKIKSDVNLTLLKANAREKWEQHKIPLTKFGKKNHAKRRKIIKTCLQKSSKVSMLLQNKYSNDAQPRVYSRIKISERPAMMHNHMCRFKN